VRVHSNLRGARNMGLKGRDRPSFELLGIPLASASKRGGAKSGEGKGAARMARTCADLLLVDAGSSSDELGGTILPLERTFMEERSITRTSSTRSLRTPSTKGIITKPEVRWEVPTSDDGFGDIECRSWSEVSSSTQSSTAADPMKKSFIRRSFQVLARRQQEKLSYLDEYSMTFHSRYSIVKAISMVRDILKSKGHRFVQEKREDTLRCAVPVRNQFKPLTVHIGFMFDIGQTEISIFCAKPPRDGTMRQAFVNFYKGLLIEMRTRGSDAVVP